MQALLLPLIIGLRGMTAVAVDLTIELELMSERRMLEPWEEGLHIEKR